MCTEVRLSYGIIKASRRSYFCVSYVVHNAILFIRFSAAYHIWVPIPVIIFIINYYYYYYRKTVGVVIVVALLRCFCALVIRTPRWSNYDFVLIRCNWYRKNDTVGSEVITLWSLLLFENSFHLCISRFWNAIYIYSVYDNTRKSTITDWFSRDLACLRQFFFFFFIACCILSI